MKKLILFAVLLPVFALSQQSMQHTTSEKNTSSNSTFLDAKGLNGNPQALIFVTYDRTNQVDNPHPVGVWYDGTRWAIFNQDMAPMPSGVVFFVTWKNPDATGFFATASAKNMVNGKLLLDHPRLNNNSSAFVAVSQVWNPEGKGGVYNNAEVIPEYDAQLGRWTVRNTNNTELPAGSSFNVFVDAGQQTASPEKGTQVTPQIIVINPDSGKEPGKKPAAGQQNQNSNTGAINNSNIINPNITINPGALVAVLADANLDFEQGLTKWRAAGAAFANQPVRGNTVLSDRVATHMHYDHSSEAVGGNYWKNIPYPIGIKNQSWIGTYENGNGDAPMGSLTSAGLRAEKRYLWFLMGGGRDHNRLFVELQVKREDYQSAMGGTTPTIYGHTDDGYVKLARAGSSLNSEELYRYYFDLDALLNQQYHNKIVRIRIVDSSDRGWGHINVDDIGFTDNIAGLIPISRAGLTVYADPDKQVFGFFDSHAHPAADEAFGKNYYVGSCSTPLSTTWSNEICNRSHTAGATLDGFTNVFDQHMYRNAGWPDMYGFPRFNSKMHQKYQADLIKRAWQGGLKIFCALGMNNMYLATRSSGHHSNGEALDDESVLLRQVAVTKEMARQNSDWMEIAYTPRDARRIILQGKLCVILGVENDVFGNFKSEDCRWQDRSGDRPLVTITESDAHQKLEAKLNEYHALGLRQILPMHYLSKPFGGTAVFNGNTFLPQIEFYGKVKVKSGVPDRVGFSLWEDFPTGPAFIGSGLVYGNYAGYAEKHNNDDGTEISMVNAEGLNNIGSILFRKLMRKGFIIDQEHVSYQAKRDIFNISRLNDNYPVMASHCGPLGLSYIWTGAPVRFSGNGQTKISNFGTSTIRYVSHEMELNDESFQGIRETEGTVGVFFVANHKRKYEGPWANIPNDCPGSTKTLAQMYAYSLDRMNGKGVGLASDLPMLDAMSPRFGPYAAFALTEETEDALKLHQRTANRMAQRNGVRYDVASRSYHPGFYEGGQIDGFEEDVWKALAAVEAGYDLNALPGRVRNFATGLVLQNQNDLLRWHITAGDAPWEQAAMFCLKNNMPPGNLSVHDDGGKRYTSEMYNRILPVWRLWWEKNGGDGTNQPDRLRRCITGNRYWDFNLDGLAHYGLLPDMLQDLKNIGFTQLQFKPLFYSAEDYIRMWEQAEAKKNYVRE